MRSINERQVEDIVHARGWGKVLIGSDQIPTTSGFNLGVAEYRATDLADAQAHDDQEALYVISGVGEIQLDNDEVIVLEPGTAVLVAPGVLHATRRTGDEPVKVIYTHGAI